MSEMLNVEALDDATRTALRRYILSLADSKRLMGIRYSDWLLGAPSIETGIAASSMCQDEWGHARLLYAMLKELGDDPDAVEHERADTEYASVDPLDEPFPDWAAVVAGMVLVDGALTVALEGFAEGNFEAATSRAPKMIAEEEFHASLAAAWFRRLATSATDEARGLLETATRGMMPPMLAWLGATDGAASALADAGVTPPAQDLAARYRDRVRGLVAEVGIDVDAVKPAGDWDEARGRGAGHPDAEACERARGDRNRMLFVE